MKHALAIVLGLMLLGLQYRLWIGAGSLADVHRMHVQAEQLREEITEAKARNAAVAAEIEALKGADADALEALARRQLGLVRESEEFFLVVNEP
jgi:cell division protein FtsB